MKTNTQEFERQVASATLRAQEKLATQPWATSVRFDRRTRRIIVTLNKGTILNVPVTLMTPVKHLTDADLAKVAVLPPGFHLDWEHLDIQVGIDWLLTGMYGNPSAKSLIGRRGRPATPKDKVTSARTKAGRPRAPRKKLSMTKSS